MRKALLSSCAACLALSAPAMAAETITYSYDARGRLIQVARSGTVNNPVTASYAFDRADNRISKIVSGSGQGAARCIVVVPAGQSYRIIPCNRAA